MPSDFIPKGRASFDEWAQRFREYVTANYASIGLTAAQRDEIANAVISSHSSFVDKQEKENIYRGAVGKDRENVKIAEQALRKYRWGCSKRSCLLVSCYHLCWWNLSN